MAGDTATDLPLYTETAERGRRPVIPLRETPAVARGVHKPPCCEHGEWTFAGADDNRQASMWRCTSSAARSSASSAR